MCSHPTNIIDWNLADKLANGDRAFAEEMICMLVESLPETLNLLTQAYQTQDWDHLERETHKLHGATCYCGTPRLKAAAKNLELILQESYTSGKIKFLYHDLIHEIQLLLEHQK